MAKPTKDGVKVSYVLDRETAEMLDKFCDETGRTKTKVVELAIQEFVEKHKGESTTHRLDYRLEAGACENRSVD